MPSGVTRFCRGIVRPPVSIRPNCGVFSRLTQVTGKLHSVLGIVEQERGFMVRTRKLAGAALAAALVVGGLTAGSAAASATVSTCGGTNAVTTVNGTLQDGATYEIQCPGGAWNGTLFLYSHGYVTPGWAIQQALPDQVNTLNVFDQAFGKPRTTIAWGHSLGGIITAGLIQDYPNLF